MHNLYSPLVSLVQYCCCLLQILIVKFKLYIRDPWNIFDQLMYTILLVAIILRFTLSDSDFVAARYVYTINLIMFYLRILHLYYIHVHLGPKVIVIWRMVQYLRFSTVRRQNKLS